jgi:NAD(P)-dependent dehydrogenase (short-subunit alcohol dehydrogenase family)
VNADKPNPTLLAYATKGAIQNITAGLAQWLAEKGIRANCVRQGDLDTAHTVEWLRRDFRRTSDG